MAIVNLTMMLCGLAYATALSGMYVFQRDLQYFPGQSDPAPRALGLTGVMRETLETPDEETLVLWFSPAKAGQPTILFLHGNAGTIADRIDRLGF